MTGLLPSTPIIIGMFCWSLTMVSCSHREHCQEATFTRADSLTDRYLQLHDSVLLAWNTIVSDENTKRKSMHQLIHDLMVSGTQYKDDLIVLEEQLAQLDRLALSQETVANNAMITEYDLISAAAVSALVRMARDQQPGRRAPALRENIDRILEADLRVRQNRSNYDAVAHRYNLFVNKNEALVKEINGNIPIQEKAIFRTVTVAE